MRRKEAHSYDGNTHAERVGNASADARMDRARDTYMEKREQRRIRQRMDEAEHTSDYVRARMDALEARIEALEAKG